MDKSTHQIRCEHWTQIINECLSSGMTKKERCKANGISDKTFYYQHILRNETYLEHKQLEAVYALKPTPPVVFVELKPAANTSAVVSTFKPDVIIRKKGIILELSNTVSPELLKQLRGIRHTE